MSASRVIVDLPHRGDPGGAHVWIVWNRWTVEKHPELDHTYHSWDLTAGQLPQIHGILAKAQEYDPYTYLEDQYKRTPPRKPEPLVLDAGSAWHQGGLPGI